MLANIYLHYVLDGSRNAMSGLAVDLVADDFSSAFGVDSTDARRMKAISRKRPIRQPGSAWASFQGSGLRRSYWQQRLRANVIFDQRTRRRLTAPPGMACH